MHFRGFSDSVTVRERLQSLAIMSRIRKEQQKERKEEQKKEIGTELK